MLYMATRPRKPVGISNIFFRSTHGSRSVASMLEASRMPPNGRRLNPSDTMCWCSPKLTSRPTWFTRTSTLSPTFTLSGAQECLKNTTPGWLSWSNVPLSWATEELRWRDDDPCYSYWRDNRLLADGGTSVLVYVVYGPSGARWGKTQTPVLEQPSGFCGAGCRCARRLASAHPG